MRTQRMRICTCFIIVIRECTKTDTTSRKSQLTTPTQTLPVGALSPETRAECPSPVHPGTTDFRCRTSALVSAGEHKTNANVDRTHSNNNNRALTPALTPA
jgi:hypothetical protein